MKSRQHTSPTFQHALWSSIYAPAPSLPSGFDALDSWLPGGGWPRGALTEILTSPVTTPATLQMLAPALARLSHEQRWLAWIAPPQIPCAATLTTAGIDPSRVLLIHPQASSDGLWAVERALRAGTCGAVLSWVAGAEPPAMRRLQRAAEASDSIGIVFRPNWAALQPSPAPLRLEVEDRDDNRLRVHILKRPVGGAVAPFYLEPAKALTRAMLATTADMKPHHH